MPRNSNIKEYLIKAQGFNESEMLILCDDGRAHPPTRKNIEDAFRRITEYSQAGDVVFVHVSPFGTRYGCVLVTEMISLTLFLAL